MNLDLDVKRMPPTDEQSGRGFPLPPAIVPEKTLSPSQWGMLAFLVSEVTFFGTLITAYVSYMGQDTTGPKPHEALSLPLTLWTTAFLLASSGTIHWAEIRFREGRASPFLVAWLGTIVLGIAFLLGTAYEWRELIVTHHLTISRNLFGSTFYTLVGFHALHVTMGVVAMSAVWGLMLFGALSVKNEQVVQLVAWYWHFVDGVWIAVFTLVYVVGR